MQKLPRPNNLQSGLKETPLDQMPYRPGWFGYQPVLYHGVQKYTYCPVISWTHCRDLFQDVDDFQIHEKGMWFCHKKNQGHSICAFIEKVENTISQKRKITKRTVFMETKYHNILWIQPGPFWVNDFVRRSFFTLCLRSGQWYRRSKDNFKQAMYHYEIAQETQPAVERFLQGYTHYVLGVPEFNTMGWSYLFFGEQSDKLEKLLVKE